MTASTEPNKSTKLPFQESHAFIIGINEYHHYPKLRTAVNDANTLAEILAKEQQFNVHPPLLNACRDELKEFLEKTMLEKVGAEDRCLLYFAGHGIAKEGEEIPEGYLIAADAIIDDISSYYSMRDLYKAINKLSCNHFLLILDCCFAGVLKWWTRYRGDRTRMPKCIFKERYDRFVKDPAWQVITSAASDQLAIDNFPYITIGNRENDEMNHSPFANTLFEGLRGAADIIPVGKGDGLITATELYLYLRDAVETLTIDTNSKRRQTPAIFSLEKHDKGEYIFLKPNHILNLPPTPDRSPYKGLLPFTEKDENLFYGRNRVINELLQRIKKQNLIVVTGASGSGKSSVVKAGLIPELRRQGYDIQVIHPGTTPTSVLQIALLELKIRHQDIFQSDQIDNLASQIVLPKAVLVIDQYEEQITECQDEEDRHRFNQILKNLLHVDQNNLFKIILTVSADYKPPQKGDDIKPCWQDAIYVVPSLDVGELRDIILMPTTQVVMDFKDPDLVDWLIDEFNKTPGALPLLSLILNECFLSYIKSNNIDRSLEKKDYKELIEKKSPLYKQAEIVQNIFSDSDQRKTLCKILMRLVSIDGNNLTHRKLPVEELEFSDAENKCAKQIVSTLIETRLLVKNVIENKEVYLELAHPALIEVGKTLEGWPKETDKDRILLQNSLAEAVKKHAFSNGKLWDDDIRLVPLQKECRLPDSWLNKHEVIFVEKSIARRKKKKIRNWTTAISIIIILVTVLFFANHKSKIARANSLATIAQENLMKHPIVPLGYAKQAYDLDQNDTVLRVLSTAAANTLEHPLYNLNIQHTDHINDTKFSPSGQQILTVSSDKTAKLWDLKGHLLITLNHNTVVSAGEFSPLGDHILTVARDNYARLWDLHGRLLLSLPHLDRVIAAHFSPDNRLILTTCLDNPAYLWDLHGHLLGKFDTQNPVTTAVFSPDNRQLITVSEYRTATLWDVQGKLKAVLDKHRDNISTVAFSPDGTRLLTASRDKTAKLWNLQGTLLTDFHAYKEIVTSAIFAPDGASIFMFYLDGTIKRCDLSGNPLATFKHQGIVTTTTFSHHHPFILTASADHTAKLWDFSGTLYATLDMHTDRVNSAVFSPDGTQILTASQDNTAKLWDLRDQPAIEFNGYKEAVTQAIFSPNGTKILTVSRDNQVKIIDLYNHHEVIWTPHQSYINSASFSPDSRLILTASADTTAKLWDNRGILLQELKQHTANVNTAVFSPDGQTILTASNDSTAKLWDLHGYLLLNLAKHTSALTLAIFSPDGQKILTASYDRTAKLWDLQGHCVQDFPLNNYPVEAAVFSPDSSKIITVSDIACMFDLDGNPLAKFSLGSRPNGGIDIHTDFSVMAAVFSSDGRHVLTISNNNNARLWDIKGNLLAQFNGHDRSLNSAVFSPDGKRILTASADKTAKLWDLQGHLLADFNKHKGNVYSAVFSPDGLRILSASADKTVKLWYTPEGIIRWLQKSRIPGSSQE